MQKAGGSVKLATRRERLLVLGAEAYKLRKQGWSVQTIAYVLQVSRPMVYRGLIAVERAMQGA